MSQTPVIAGLPGRSLPDYGGAGIVNLMSSVAVGRGYQQADYPPLGRLSGIDLGSYRNVVLLVIDGLGHDYLMTRFPRSTIATHLRTRLTSVFPTTTAAAITTFMTGLAPAQHAITGWHMWLEEIRTVAAVLPFHSRIGRAPLAARGHDLQALLEPRPIYPLLEADCHVISPTRIANSLFNTALSAGATIHSYEGLAGFYRTIVDVVGAGQTTKYIYAYWPELDHLGHEHGIGSAAATTHFAEIDLGFARLIRDLKNTDTLLLLTADHGFVDTEPQTHIRLRDHAALTAMLDVPLCGEPRAAYCYIHHGEAAAFEMYMASELEAACTVVPSQRLIDEGVFGPGKTHPRLQARVGDYTVVMNGNFCIGDTVPGEADHRLVGVHGGLSAAELYVPLTVVAP